MVSQFLQKQRLRPISEPDRIDAILKAIGNLELEDIQRLGGWAPLEEISSATQFDGIEGAPTGVFQADGSDFVVSGTVYVTLQYGGSRDNLSMSDSYPAIIKGKFVNDVPEIVGVEVDNTSFYE